MDEMKKKSILETVKVVIDLAEKVDSDIERSALRMFLNMRKQDAHRIACIAAITFMGKNGRTSMDIFESLCDVFIRYQAENLIKNHILNEEELPKYLKAGMKALE